MLFLFNLKSENVIIKAKYLQLACEDCFHMQVQWSNDRALTNNIIIPISDTLNIEVLINGVLEKNNDSLCLFGSKYLFNPNISISPDGIRFLVNKVLDSNRCMDNGE